MGCGRRLERRRRRRHRRWSSARRASTTPLISSSVITASTTTSCSTASRGATVAKGRTSSLLVLTSARGVLRCGSLAMAAATDTCIKMAMPTLMGAQR
uniref:Uncharacterized protein n=1 Tax=Arundo donax TaxID=35708 RepID=A0A0A9G8M8_ARUDO